MNHSTNDIIIVGAGSHARVVLDIFEEKGEEYNVAGFINVCDDPDFDAQIIDGLPLLGRISDLKKLRDEGYKRAIVALGDNQKRLELIEQLENLDFQILSALHPESHISSRVEIDVSCTISAGATILTGSRLSKGVIVNTGATLDHDNIIAEGVQIAPGVNLGGHVKIGRKAFVGIGASVIQGVTIGEEAVIGAGAAVISDIPSNATAVGIPAKVIKKK